MASTKEIKSKIASIKNTGKITKAMEMVAASKMRKAQDKMNASSPYASAIREVVGRLAHADTDYKHPFMIDRPVKSIGYIVISSDRGLCGGLNNNLFKKMTDDIGVFRAKNIAIEFCLIGSKAVKFFNSFGGNVLAALTHLGEKPSLQDLIGSVKVMLDRYKEGRIDKLLVVHNRFISAMVQEPHILQLVPLEPDDSKEFNETKSTWDYIYEPQAKKLLDSLLVRYIESQLYHALIENNACEQTARMIAMKSASDNAKDLIGDLQLIYNKVRQATITQELSEIVGGASAV